MLRIILGGAGAGKTYRCLAEISEELKQDPAGPPLLLIVPEESTFAMEQAILGQSGLAGVYRAQVLGFRRLRWRILQSAGGIPEPPLGDQGRKLLLAGIIQTHRDKLTVFQDVAGHPGFVDKLSRTIGELQEAGLGLAESAAEVFAPPSLASSLEAFEPVAWREIKHIDGGKVLEAKAHDLALLWMAYQRELQRLGLVDDHHAWVKAIDGVPRASFLEEAMVWIDGVNCLGAPEIGLVAGLLEKVKEISITLRLEPTSIEKDDGAFAYCAATLKSLVELAEALSVPYRVETVSYDKKLGFLSGQSSRARTFPPRFRRSQGLAHLEEQLRYPKGQRIPYQGTNPGLWITSAANRRDEVMQGARFLIGEARDKGVRWRDMAVASSDLNLYGELLAGVFADCGIPFFLDQPRPVHWHPLMVFVSGVLELVTGDWETRAVMQVLKSDLAPMGRQAVDCLENQILANGIDGRLWLEPRFLDQLRSDLGESSGLDELLAPLLQFYEKVAPSKETPMLGRQLITALWSLVEEFGIPARLNYWITQEPLTEGMSSPDGAVGAGLASTADHSGIWNLWVDLVDDFMQSLGNTLLIWEEFASVMQASLDNLRLTRIPQGLDQVLVSTPNRLVNVEVSVLMILGGDEKHLRVVEGEDTILNDAERLALQPRGWSLEPQRQSQMVREPFFWYSLFTRAKESLYVSYPLADGDGKALGPATIVKDLKELFPGLEGGANAQEADHFSDTPIDKDAQLPCTIADAASFVGTTLGKYKDSLQGEIDSTNLQRVLALYDWLLGQEQGRVTLKRCLAGLNYTNQAGPLSDAITRQLHGDTFVTNIHHLEAAAACPFQFFARAVLRLEERAVLRWDPRVEGQLWHEALASLTRHLWKKRQDLAELDDAELKNLADEIWQTTTQEYAPAYADVVESYASRIARMGRGFQRVVMVLAEHARRGQFRPIAVEAAFGSSQKLSAWEIPLDAHNSVHLRGRIDRIEAAKVGDTLYLRVIDFKRGGKKLGLADVYHGFSLQLLAYVGALMDNRQAVISEGALRVIPVGALYFPLSEPLVKLEGPVDEKDLEAALLAKYKTSGIMLADADVIDLMESGLSGRSELLPVGIKKDGGFYSDSSAYSAHDCQVLLEYVKDHIRNQAKAILKGEVGIWPYRKVRSRPCTYCPYMPVCRFELGVPGCGYRYIPELSSDEALAYMAEAVGQRQEVGGKGGVDGDAR